MGGGVFLGASLFFLASQRERRQTRVGGAVWGGVVSERGEKPTGLVASPRLKSFEPFFFMYNLYVILANI